jgi:hypothetical protein
MFGTGDFPRPPEGLSLPPARLVSKGNSGHSFHVVCSELYNNVVLVAEMTTEMCPRASLRAPYERVGCVSCIN